jgi:hypothetical protein
MVSEDEFFAQADSPTESNTEIVSPALINKLKEQRDEVNKLYAKLIANPYLAPHLVPDFRSALMGTVAVLMENGVPVSDNPKIRTPDDVVKEGLAELGGMLGGKVVGNIMKMKKTFSDTMSANADDDDFVVYRDPDSGTYYFIEDGEEVDCDKYGNPLE